MNSKELAVYSMAIDKLLEHDLVKDAREVLQFAIAQAPPQKQNDIKNQDSNHEM